MNTLFLIFALALRPVSFPPIHGDAFYEEIAASFHMTYPGREMWFVKGMELPEREFDKVPWVTYRGYTIYAKKAA
jgi:hypothetical protein